MAPLYRIDPVTGDRIEIEPRRGKNRERPGVNRALIKAWAHDSTPVPDFSFTDFFTKLFPQALFDRMARAETLHDRSQGLHTHRTKTTDRNHYHPKFGDEKAENNLIKACTQGLARK